MNSTDANQLNWPSQRPTRCPPSAPAHEHCGQADPPHKCAWEGEICSNNQTLGTKHQADSFLFNLPLVWWDINAVRVVIPLRDHFHSVGTVVHYVGPRLSQQKLHGNFKVCICKIAIIGGVEAVGSDSHDVIDAGKIQRVVLHFWSHTLHRCLYHEL